MRPQEWLPRSGGAVRHPGRAGDVLTAETALAGTGAPSIGTQRLLSNGRSMALVDPNGQIGWWCAPDPHSVPMFWRLLSAGGAAAAWEGCSPSAIDGEASGPTLRTTVQTPAGRLQLWDGLLSDERGLPLLVRLVRALESELHVEHTMTLGGFDCPFAPWTDAATTVNGLPLWVHGGRHAIDRDVLRSTLTATRGVWTALTVGSDRVPQHPDDLSFLLRRADDGHRRALDRALPPKHHPQRARDALSVLRSCTFHPTGAVVAAVTTSLPEAVGGTRQFDYRFCWLRDAAAGVAVAALFGDLDAARHYLGFVEEVVERAGHPQIVTDVHGNDVPDERDVDDVDGWMHSRPVRVGNSAADQIQHDALGMFIESVSVFVQQGGKLEPSTWRLVKSIADGLCDDPGPTNGIWEFRTARPLVCADIGRWLGLDRAIWISRGWRPLTNRKRWMAARAEIRRRVLGAIDADGGLPQAYGERESPADASALLLPLFGLLAGNDPRASRLIDATLAQLDAHPFAYRYPPTESDGFSGLENTFTVASWWVVGALAAVGRVAEARDRAGELDRRLPRLIAEEIDATSGVSLGNTPLVWAHMEAARALYLLDAAARRQRFTVVGLSAWRLGRFTSLRFRSRFRRHADEHRA